MKLETKKQIKEVSLQIIYILFAAFVGWSIGRHDNSIQYLDYRVTSINNVTDNVQTDIKINSMEAKQFSIVNVKVFNRTNKDYDNLLLTFRLLIDSPVVFGYDVKNWNNVKLTNTSAGKTNEYTFASGTANRDDERPIVEASFLVSGTIAPDCLVLIDQTGVKTKKERNPMEFTLWSNSLATYIQIAILFVFIVVIVNNYIIRKVISKRDKIDPFGNIPRDREEYNKFLQAWVDAQKKKEGG